MNPNDGHYNIEIGENDMAEDERVENEIAIQKNIEKELFDEQGKILDRFYSLITLIFTALGIIFTILSFMFGKNISNIKESIQSYYVSFCLFCIFTAFLISIINVLAIFHHRKLVKRVGKIRYREDNELVNNNLKLYDNVARQKNYYIIAVALIGLGFASFFNQFSQHRVLSMILTAGFILIAMLLIHNSRRYLI